MGGDEDRIADLLDRLALLQRSRQQQAAGLNPAQWEALRYLARANRYSRSPTALTDYLGSTKGTVSQTLIALERKGYVARRPAADRRSLRLELTAAGRALLAGDPLQGVAAAAQALPPARRAALAAGLAALLAALQRANGRRAFGLCATCRFFRRDDAAAEAGGPHRCGLTLEPLSEADARLICAEHAAA